VSRELGDAACHGRLGRLASPCGGRPRRHRPTLAPEPTRLLDLVNRNSEKARTGLASALRDRMSSTRRISASGGADLVSGERESHDEITEREVPILAAEFATVWNELFPAEQARIVSWRRMEASSRRRPLRHHRDSGEWPFHAAGP
jgi:hypothetical protein